MNRRWGWKIEDIRWMINLMIDAGLNDRRPLTVELQVRQ